jgi:hypothetical protein
MENLSKPVKEGSHNTTEGDSKLMDALKGDVKDGSKLMDALNDKSIQENDVNEKKQGLTDEQKNELKEPPLIWSDSIVDAIGSEEERDIYIDAGLDYDEVNGKDCLTRSDIDYKQKDEFGRTNKERMEQGLAPLDKNGKPIELHHIGQKPDSPLAELTQEEHRGKGNDGVLHDKTKETEIDRVAFKQEKEEHWKTRAESVFILGD